MRNAFNSLSRTCAGTIDALCIRKRSSSRISSTVVLPPFRLGPAPNHYTMLRTLHNLLLVLCYRHPLHSTLALAAIREPRPGYAPLECANATRSRFASSVFSSCATTSLLPSTPPILPPHLPRRSLPPPAWLSLVEDRLHEAQGRLKTQRRALDGRTSSRARRGWPPKMAC
jgi:hypothetical protein